MTESHAGSDLGLIRAKAKENTDGSYTVTGTKIFITGGDQDLTENIIWSITLCKTAFSNLAEVNLTCSNATLQAAAPSCLKTFSASAFC